MCVALIGVLYAIILAILANLSVILLTPERRNETVCSAVGYTCFVVPLLAFQVSSTKSNVKIINSYFCSGGSRIPCRGRDVNCLNKFTCKNFYKKKIAPVVGCCWHSLDPPICFKFSTNYSIHQHVSHLQVLLAYKEDSVKEYTYIAVTLPLFVSLFTLIMMSFGSKGANQCK